MPEKSVQECKLCHCGDGLCQNHPKKEGVVLHLKHNSRKEGGENCEQTSSEPIWYMDGNLAIRTGGTKMLAFNITNEFYRDLNSVGTVTAMRNAAHGTLYALANSFAVTRAVSVPKWVKTTYAVDAVVAIILVAWEICAIRKYRKAKKEDEDTEQ